MGELLFREFKQQYNLIDYQNLIKSFRQLFKRFLIDKLFLYFLKSEIYENKLCKN